LLQSKGNDNNRRNGFDSVEWEVINTCNAKCWTCISWTESENDAVLSFSKASHIIDRLAEAGFTKVCFTGGEPMLRKDLFRLLALAKRKGFTTELVSNGLLINERKARLLVDSKLDILIVSIDAADPQLNDRLRGIEGYHELALAAVENIRTMRGNALPKVVLQATISNENVEQLVPLAELTLNSSIDGFHFRIAQDFKHSFYQVGTAQEITDVKKKLLMKQIDIVMKQYKNILHKSMDEYQALRNAVKNVDSLNLHNSQEYDRILYIDAYGNVFSSSKKDMKLGNLVEDSVSAVFGGKNFDTDETNRNVDSVICVEKNSTGTQNKLPAFAGTSIR